MTWKADGTRYNMLLLKYGAYLVDRSGEVRRHNGCGPIVTFTQTLMPALTAAMSSIGPTL